MSASGSLGAPPMRGFFGFWTTTRFAAGRSIRVASPACTSPVSVGVVSSVISISPARLRHAGQLAHERALAETDPAQTELAHVATGAAADLAAVVGRHLVLVRPLGFEDQAFLRHEMGLGPFHPLRGCLERHAEAAQKRARLLIRLGRRDDRDLHAAETVDLVVVDLREHELLLETEREVSTTVEAAVRDALEVADARERHGDELLVEMPHALAAQRDLQADRHADAQLEVRDSAAGLGNHRTLAGDLREIRRRGVHGFSIADRLAHPDVEDDLLESRDLHHVLEAELLAQLVPQSRVVPLLHRARHSHLYSFSSTTIDSPHRLQMRSLVSSSMRCATRVASPQCGQMTMTLPSESAIGWSMIPPLLFLDGFGLVWRFPIFAPAPATLPDTPSTSWTLPRLPPSRA